jgi:serine/threonine protein phosphatase PrpC
MNPNDDTLVNDSSETTAPLPALPTIGGPMSARCRVDYGAATHQGLRRDSNEDRYTFARIGRSLQTLLTNLPEQRLPRQLEDVGYGMLVADGMGGAAAGEFAAELAILTLVNLALDTPDWLMSSQEEHAERVLQRMSERFRQIDDLLKERGKTESVLAGMATTMTLACSVGPRAVVVHVGDSRAYLLRSGTLHRLTKDHTLAQEFVDAGIFQRTDQVARHLQHALTRCLGGNEASGEPDVQQLLLADGDQLLLCTDGLSNMVSDADIARILGQTKTADDACAALVAAALDGGGKDNVTVVLARYRFP